MSLQKKRSSVYIVTQARESVTFLGAQPCLAINDRRTIFSIRQSVCLALCTARRRLFRAGPARRYHSFREAVEPSPIMTSTKPEPAVADLASPYRLQPEIAGLVMLAMALLFNAFMLAPETWIERVPVNDLPFHIAASQRLAASVVHGEPFLDPWVSQWSLGFPLWRLYQPLPHLVAGTVMALCRPFASPASTFAVFYYLLLVIFPLSVYIGVRLIGLNPLAAGLASILVLTPNEGADFGRFGLSYGAFVWRGSGLYTELFAIEVMLPALGLVAWAIDSGNRKIGAALGLALTTLSHIFFGYVAFVTTAVWALAGPRDGRSRRIARAASIAGMAILLLLWFVVPMFLTGAEVNRSRWDPAWKWDSYGAPIILREVFSGRMFDFGRLPVLSLMVALGTLVALFNLKESLPRRLLALTAVWLALFFGRETWGHLLLLVGMPSLFHMHRLQAPFELFALITAAWGLEQAISAAMNAPRFVTLAAGAALGGAIIFLAQDRAQFLTINRLSGEATLFAFERERGDLEAAFADIRAILAECPGRVSAGQALDWGESFRIGDARVFSFITRNRLDSATNLYHSISLTSDYMVLRDENNSSNEDFFGIRAALAPATLKVPAFFRKRSVHGRFAVYEVSPEGYFSLVDLGASYSGPPATWYDPIVKWLPSWMLRAGEVIALNSGNLPGVPAIGRWSPMPNPNVRFMTPRGKILSESRVGQIYRMSVDVQRPCYAYFKMTFFPGMTAIIDGRREPIIRVFPDFCAFPLTPGHHEVQVSFQPGPLKPLLFLAGILMFVLVARPALGAYREGGEIWLEERLGQLGARLSTDRAKTAIALGLLILLFTRSLFRGVLVDGHDSLAYPARVTEFTRIIADHQFPPLWAPDLGSGHGQPLFEFAPPLVYAVALPFFNLGMGIADSLQFGLIVLFAIGAVSVYLIGRKLSFSRVASLGAAAAWLFAPYQAIDMYVSVRMAEASALCVAPLALLGLIAVLESPTLINIVLAAAAIALVPLAHNGVALLTFPIFAAIIAGRAAIARSPVRTAAGGLLALAGGLGLSAFFWLPAILEKDFVNVELLRSGYFDWRIHIISWWQLFWGHWGFGISVAGPNDGMSFSLGLPHIAIAIAGAFIGVRALNRTRRLDAIIFACAALAGALLATDLTAPIWARIPTLQYLQFPWRTLLLPAMFMPLLALYLFERVGAKPTVALIALLVIVNLHHTEPKGYQTFDEEYFSAPLIAKTGYETTSRGEYQPRWVLTPLGYTGDGLLSPPSGMSIRTLSRSSAQHEYSLAAPADANVVDSTNYYPGWTVLIDGHETPIKPTPGSGLITFNLPAGEHHVLVELRNTSVRQYAEFCTIATLIALVLMTICHFVFVRKKPAS